MKGLSLCLEVLVKILISFAGGLGVSLVALGLVLGGGVTDCQDFQRHGPPPAPFLIACGLGFLSGALILLLFSVGRHGRKRWFVISEEPAETYENLRGKRES